MKKYSTRLLFAIAVLAASYYFAQLRLEFSGESPATDLHALTEGRGSTPFQYRVLIFWIAKGMLRLELLSPDTLYGFFRVVETLSVFSLVFAMRWVLAPFIEDAPTCSLLSLSTLYVLPFHYLYPRALPYFFVSDLPSVLFFALGLGLIYRRRWVLFYPLYVLAVLNRETAGFLTIVYLATAIRLDQPKIIAGHCIAQTAIWFALKSYLFALYAGNPGQHLLEIYHEGTTVTHLSTNLQFLIDPLNLPLVLSIFGFAWIPVLAFSRHLKEPFLRDALLAVFPFLLVMTWVGNLYELRIFGELIPIVLPAALVILRGMVGPGSDGKLLHG